MTSESAFHHTNFLPRPRSSIWSQNSLICSLIKWLESPNYFQNAIRVDFQITCIELAQHRVLAESPESSSRRRLSHNSNSPHCLSQAAPRKKFHIYHSYKPTSAAAHHSRGILLRPHLGRRLRSQCCTE